MKSTIFLAAAALSATLASASISRAQSTFPDVPDNHWAAEAVRKLAEAGIIQGYPARPVPAPVAAPKAAPKPAARAPQPTHRKPSAKAKATRR